MSVINVSEKWSGRDASFQSSYERRYTRVFQVITDDKATSQIEVAFATGIPNLWSWYYSFEDNEFDSLAVCDDISVTQDNEDPLYWEVKCSYTTKPNPENKADGTNQKGKPGDGGAADTPEDRRPELKISWETLKLPLIKSFDNGGNPTSTRVIPVKNSAKRPFNPRPEYETGGPVLTITRLEKIDDFDLDADRAWAYVLNDSTWWGHGEAQVLCMPIERDLVYIGDNHYWKSTYKFRFIPNGYDTWFVELLDAGQEELDDDGKQTRIMVDGQPVSEDWPLDGAGKALTAAQLDADEEVYLTFYQHRRKDFAPLNLDKSDLNL